MPVLGGTREAVNAAAPSAASLRIVDAHHHLWDTERNYHPWLRDDPPIPFRYGSYEAIRRPYLPADYERDASPRVVEASVYVETEWDHRDPTGEMDYVAELIATSGRPSVAVAQAWLDRVDIPAVLESHAARGFVRSVRHKPRANPGPRDAAPGGMTDLAWRAGFARLAPLGLRFDLQTPWWHLHEAVKLAGDYPSTMIVLNHTGLPADRSAEGIAAWRAAMGALAKAPNVMVKISGIGQRGEAWTVAANRDIVLTTIDLFGVERCMFASNFPVDGLCASFSTIFDGFAAIVATLDHDEQVALFNRNARRVYAIGDDNARA